MNEPTPTIFVDQDGNEIRRAYLDHRAWMNARGGCTNCMSIALSLLPANDPTVPDEGAYILMLEIAP